MLILDGCAMSLVIRVIRIGVVVVFVRRLSLIESMSMLTFWAMTFSSLKYERIYLDNSI